MVRTIKVKKIPKSNFTRIILPYNSKNLKVARGEDNYNILKYKHKKFIGIQR